MPPAFSLLLLLWKNMHVKIWLDIPDKFHSKLKKKARREGTTVKALILRSVQAMLKDKAKSQQRRRPPTTEAEKPGSLYLDNAEIFELIDLP